MICAFEGCDRPRRALSFCASHYRQWWEGRPLTPLRIPGNTEHTCTKHAPGQLPTCYSKCGCRCQPCRRIRERERKQVKAGWRRRVDAVGTRRRLQALAAIGHDDATIAAECGFGTDRVKDLRGWPTTVRQDTAATVTAAYNRLSMTLPDDSLRARQRRTYARTHGWSPPLAWDDAGPHGIDNPDATPCNPDGTETTIERISWLADGGCSIATITASLGVGEEAVEQACRRAGRLDLWKQLREAA